jgi:hypothetical protein
VIGAERESVVLRLFARLEFVAKRHDLQVLGLGRTEGGGEQPGMPPVALEVRNPLGATETGHERTGAADSWMATLSGVAGLSMCVLARV